MNFDDWRDQRFDSGFDSFDPDDRFGRFHPPSRPIEAKGGIKALSQRGRFGESWWARRWIEVLESFDIGSRLQRGRSYARKGQVLSIDVKKSAVEARVQGSRPEPYRVGIKVSALSSADWQKLAAELSRQALFAAKLLAGQMPPDIEQAFSAAGLSLFPEKLKEITTTCSCPDHSNPCKHIAAVYYLLGEAFDGDPFLIFRMRGIDREEFTALLLSQGADRTAAESLAEETQPAEPEPLSAKPEDFWGLKLLPADLLGDVTLARPLASLPRRLGNLQFWRGESPLVQALEPAYREASRRGQILLSAD